MASMTGRIGLAVAVLGLVAGGVGRAEASLIVGDVSGQIYSISYSPTLDPFTEGDEVSLSFAFDIGPDEYFDDSNVTATYPLVPSPFRLLLPDGSVDTIEMTEGRMYVDDGTGNIYSPNLSGTADIVRLRFEGPDDYVDLEYYNPSGTALSSTAPPTSAELLGFQWMLFIYGKEGEPAETFRANAYPFPHGSTLPPAAVPEPATFATAGLGVLMGLGYAWRRKRAA